MSWNEDELAYKPKLNDCRLKAGRVELRLKVA